RSELIGRRLQDVAEKLCGGSLTPLLTHLVRTRRLSPRERRELGDLIDELDQIAKRRGETSRKGGAVGTLVRVGLTNAVTSALLAVAVLFVARWCRRPAVKHGLWLLVLIKLVTPPLVDVTVAWPGDAAPTPPAPALAAPAEMVAAVDVEEA